MVGRNPSLIIFESLKCLQIKNIRSIKHLTNNSEMFFCVLILAHTPLIVIIYVWMI